MTEERKGTRHEQVREALISRLQRYDVGDKLPSDRDFAAELGVAYLTVNRAMCELAWEGYVERRPRKGTFVASPEKTVRSDLSTGTLPGERVVFAYPNYFSYSMWIRLRCAEEQAVKRGLGLLEFKTNCDTSYENLCDFVRASEHVRGLLLLPVPGSIDRSILSLLDDLDVPVVILAACEIASLGRRIWSVTTDWYKAGYLRADCLVRSGHRDIAYVHNEPEALEWRRLLRGMRRAVGDGKLRRRDLTVFGRGVRPWQDSQKAGYELTVEALEQGGPTGIAYDSFSGALGGLRAMWEKGLDVPEDVSVVSSGGAGGHEGFTTPLLTTVDERPGEEVRLAFECVLGGSAASCRELTVPPVLSTRQSIARPSTERKAGRSSSRSSAAV
jgi:DNA-binding LacI/PurR family transcriptional regulator